MDKSADPNRYGSIRGERWFDWLFVYRELDLLVINFSKPSAFTLIHVRMNTSGHRGITLQAIQSLLDQLEESKQSRLRARKVLHRLRSAGLRTWKSRHGPAGRPCRKEKLEHALAKSLRIRNQAIKSLCASVRRFRDATIKEE
jgi:hypothetical protein